MTDPKDRVRRAVKQSEHYRFEDEGCDKVPHVCVTVDFEDLPFGNINLTEPKDDVATAVSMVGWAIVRSESAMGVGGSRRRVWFGDPGEL